jgi:hypothetical protein
VVVPLFGPKREILLVKEHLALVKFCFDYSGV